MVTTNQPHAELFSMTIMKHDLHISRHKILGGFHILSGPSISEDFVPGLMHIWAVSIHLFSKQAFGLWGINPFALRMAKTMGFGHSECKRVNQRKGILLDHNKKNFDFQPMNA